MRRTLHCAIAAAAIALGAQTARSQCLPIVCGVTIVLQSDASGIALTGSGGASATMAFGTMSAFGGSVPSGVTKNVGASSWTITTPFDVKVECENLLSLLPCTILISPSYTLTAQLQSADSTNTWKIGSSTLSSVSATTLTTTGSFGNAVQYTFGLTIPFSESAGLVSNSVNFLAIAN